MVSWLRDLIFGRGFVVAWLRGFVGAWLRGFVGARERPVFNVVRCLLSLERESEDRAI